MGMVPPRLIRPASSGFLSEAEQTSEYPERGEFADAHVKLLTHDREDQMKRVHPLDGAEPEISPQYEEMLVPYPTDDDVSVQCS